MKIAVVILCVTVASAHRYWKRAEGVENNFDNFKHEFNRSYVNDEDEQNHKEIFEHNKRIVESVNNDPDASFSCEMSEDSDSTDNELRGTKLGLIPPSDTSVDPEHDLARRLSEDEQFDKRGKKKRVKPVNYATGKCAVAVKNQGACGSCWAFSTATTLEYRRCKQFKQSSANDRFSEQELVDCSQYSYGCRGGWMESSYRYVDEQNGLCSDSAYPYTARDGTCAQASCVHNGDLLSSFYAMWGASDKQIKKALKKYGPLAVTVKAGGTAFSSYTGGIIDSDCTPSRIDDLDHAVVLVGWAKKPVKHWIIENSWGTGYGEAGFVRIKMGKIPNTDFNYCNINSHISVPTFVDET